MNKGSKVSRPVIFFKIATVMTVAFLLLGGSLIAASHILAVKRLQNQERLEAEYLVERSRNTLKSREKRLLSIADRLAQSKSLRAILAANTDQNGRIDADLIGLKERTSSDLYDFVLIFCWIFLSYLKCNVCICCSDKPIFTISPFQNRSNATFRIITETVNINFFHNFIIF